MELLDQIWQLLDIPYLFTFVVFASFATKVVNVTFSKLWIVLAIALMFGIVFCFGFNSQPKELFITFCFGIA